MTCPRLDMEETGDVQSIVANMPRRLYSASLQTVDFTRSTCSGAAIHDFVATGIMMDCSVRLCKRELMLV